MRRDLKTAAQLLAVPTLALLVVVGLVPGRASLAIRIYALLLAATALMLVLAALRRAFPRATPLFPGEARAGKRPTPESLSQMQNTVALGSASAIDFRYRLHPRLNALARDLLASRRRISLDAEPETARSILGEEAWELVGVDREPPEDRRARGPELRSLRETVDALERI